IVFAAKFYMEHRMNVLSIEPSTAVAELHMMVTRTGNHFLKQVSSYAIDDLKLHNDPTYEDIAKDARFLASVLKNISSLGVYSEERLADNALQAALFMERMARAIND